LAKKEPEARILLLERGWWPAGASTRNAGFACFGSITELQADLEKEQEDKVKQRVKDRFDGLQLLRETLGDSAIGYEPCGGYELFTDVSAYEQAVQDISKFNGRMEELLGESEVYQVDEKMGYPVIANRLEAAIHPGRMMRNLLDLVREEGVELRMGTTVDSVEAVGVFIENGPMIRSKQTILCSNGFVRKLLPRLPVEPGRGYVMVTEPLEEQPWKGTYHHDAGYIYFRHLEGNRLLLGGARNIAQKEEATAEFGINPTIKDHLIEFASDTLKLGRDWKIETEWSGIMGFTEEKSALLQPLHPGLTVAVGLSGMGVALGMRLGQQVVEEVT
jgi:glycine/D-amino acid oxidase-like deaminating enzyme